jgi:hypothetical protein
MLSAELNLAHALNAWTGARAVVVKHVDSVLMRSLIDEALCENKSFSVINVKVDGSPRRWIIGPKQGRAQIKGEKPAPALPPTMRRVFDLSAAQKRNAKGHFERIDANGWRTLNLSTVKALRRGNTVYLTV